MLKIISPVLVLVFALVPSFAHGAPNGQPALDREGRDGHLPAPLAVAEAPKCKEAAPIRPVKAAFTLGVGSFGSQLSVHAEVEVILKEHHALTFRVTPNPVQTAVSILYGLQSSTKGFFAGIGGGLYVGGYEQVMGLDFMQTNPGYGMKDAVFAISEISLGYRFVSGFQIMLKGGVGFKLKGDITCFEDCEYIDSYDEPPAGHEVIGSGSLMFGFVF